MNFKYTVLSTLLMASSTVAFTLTSTPVSNTRLFGVADDDIESAIARAVSAIGWLDLIRLHLFRE